MIKGRWIVCALLLVGCGYRAAMERATAAQDRKDWAAAAAEYEAALQHDPDDEEANRGLAKAQRRWHAQSLSRFEKALADGDLPAANEALAEAESAQPAAPTNAVARDRLATAKDARRADELRTNARAKELQREPLVALLLWAKAEDLHSTTAGARSLKRARAAALKQAVTAEAAGRWRAADAARATIAVIDPKAKRDHVALGERWATAWRAEAEAHMAAGRDGLATVRAAQVAAISGRMNDIERKTRWVTRHHDQHALRTQLQLTGPSARVAIISAALPPSASVHPASEPLIIAGTVAPVRFSQSKMVKVRSVRYQVGTRIETNPDWVRARDAVRAARRDQERAEGALREAEDSTYKTEANAERAREDLRKKRRRTRRRLRAALADARQEEQRCQSAVRDASDAGRASARSQLKRAQRAVDEAWRALDGLATDTQGSSYESRAVERARRGLENAREAAGQARQKISDAERRLDRVEPTREVPRYARHRYPVQHWTRTGDGDLSLRVDLPGLPSEPLVLTARRGSRDRAHAAQVRVGLDADPLRFPDSDARLERQIDTALAAQLAKTVTAQEARWARALAEKALGAKTPAEQVSFALAAVLMRNASKDTITRARIILEAQADLHDLGVLRAESP